MRNQTRIGVIGFLLFVPGATLLRAQERPAWVVVGNKGIVASDSPYASRAGTDILAAGGNAIDAAVAVSFTLGVVRPYATGAGGGGFMIARMADGRLIVQDFREAAPAAATPDMFVEARKRNADGPDPSRYGGLAVAVPGLVAGRCEALSKYGTLELSKVLAPAIDYAERGCSITGDFVRVAEETVPFFEKHPSWKESAKYVYDGLLFKGAELNPVAYLAQPKLADLLRSLAQEGPDFFYKGPVARAIVETVKKHGGVLTEADLAEYKVIERRPLKTTYRDYELIGMPPPSSGGIALAQALNILEALDHASVVRKDRGLALHYQIEALKHAFADRARWLADADSSKVPVDRLISKTYGKRLASQITADQISGVDAYGSTILPDDAGTSHFCVIDQWGNVVVSTETINTSFGSLVAVEEFGLLLNNQMNDFLTEPGKPNAFDLLQSPANAAAAGKRPLSSMAPTIVMKKGEPYMLIGASGGPRIVSSVLHVLLAVTDRERELADALAEPRPHHQWQPDLVYFDRKPPGKLAEALTKRGHRISGERRAGMVQVIVRGDEEWIGASDPRRGGRPYAYVPR